MRVPSFFEICTRTLGKRVGHACTELILLHGVRLLSDCDLASTGESDALSHDPLFSLQTNEHCGNPECPRKPTTSFAIWPVYVKRGMVLFEAISIDC